MESAGWVLERRADVADAGLLLAAPSAGTAMSLPVQPATAFVEGPTTVTTLADDPLRAGLLPGVDSTGQSAVPATVTAADGGADAGHPAETSVVAGAGTSAAGGPGSGRPGSDAPAGPSLAFGPVSGLRAGGPGLGEALEVGAAAIDEVRACAVDEAGLFGLVEAADFAGRVEDMSRSLEYLQVLAAQAVERTRSEAQMAQMARRGSAATAPEWRTGWTEPGLTDTGAGVVDPTATVVLGAEGSAGAVLGAEAESSAAGLLDDGYRNAAEFLRARLRIGIGEARRRLALAAEVLPQTGMTGQHVPARREILAEALATAQVPSRSATIISTALDKVRHLTEPETLTRMEHALTATARQSDPDFLTKIAKRWADLIDQDGPEPTEETLRQLQGAFLRRRR
ncbi:DUF222 domain-containing protein, partial [Paenarthrobacter sp. FR1]|uniref:DUF222 domain-containing protein n=1 Tax=Paenarthrobacter sp. FR1 TaxID=3439548 RepID=UPI003DA25A03